MSDILKIQHLSSCDYTCVDGTKLRVKASSFINDESLSTAPIVGDGVTTPPTNPKENATLTEIYSDLTRYWVYDCDGEEWTHITDVVICKDEQVTYCRWFDALDGTSPTLVVNLPVDTFVINCVKFFYNGELVPDSSQVTAAGLTYTYSVVDDDVTILANANIGGVGDNWAYVEVTYTSNCFYNLD